MEKENYTYKFKAVVYPSELMVSAVVKLRLTYPDFDIDGELSVAINNSEIDIEYKTCRPYSKINTGEIETLKNFVEDAVRIIVDAICFSQSYYYDIYILNFISNSGFEYKFYSRGEYNINKNGDVVTKEVSNILSKLDPSNSHTALALVLADFRMGMKYPKMTASFCFRAIETIRQYYFSDDWEKMREVLNLEKEDFNEILKFGKPNRHGVYPTIQYSERESIMNFTRLIIERVLSQKN